MIEGMVMELYKDHVIVMTKSGEFLKLRKRGSVNIGDIYKENIYRRIPVRTYAAAAILIFVFTSFAGYTAYANQIVGYVDIKGTKDVRLYVSRKGNVEKVDGIQNSGQIKNLPVYQAIEKLNTIASSEGIYNNSSDVVISATELKDSKLDFNKVNEDVKKILSKDNNGSSNSTSSGKKSNAVEKNKDSNDTKTKNDTTKQNNSNIDKGTEKNNDKDANNSKDIKNDTKSKDIDKNTSPSDNNKLKNNKKTKEKETTKKFWNFWR